jgi:hypothetical protein
MQEHPKGAISPRLEVVRHEWALYSDVLPSAAQSWSMLDWMRGTRLMATGLLAHLAHLWVFVSSGAELFGESDLATVV